MAFIIKNPPEFTLEIEPWTRETYADGPEMAKDLGKLLNNDVYLKTEVERLTGKKLLNITIPASGWDNLTYTISDVGIVANSNIDVYFDFNSIPAAQKINIRYRQEPSKLILVAKKQPTVDLIIELIHIRN